MYEAARALGMDVPAYEQFVGWLSHASLDQLAALLDLTSIKFASMSPGAEIHARRAASAARQEDA